MEGFSVGLVLGAVMSLVTVLFCAYLCYKAAEPLIKAMHVFAEGPKTRKEHKAETTESNYAGRLYGYLKAGAKLNAVQLGTIWKVEVLKPELVGGPDNGATKISVRWQGSPLFDVFVDGDYVETEPHGFELPVARRLRYNDESIDRLGWVLGDYVRAYPDVHK